MRIPGSFLVLLAASATTCAVAQELDGTAPLSCKVQGAFDCLPGQASCGKLTPETKIDPVYTVNFAGKEVHSPFRTEVLKIAHSTINKESLVLQGAEAAIAWSAMIKKATGDMTITVADRKGAYVAFGQCKVATPAAAK
jgi:hypothetical protein